MISEDDHDFEMKYVDVNVLIDGTIKYLEDWHKELRTKSSLETIKPYVF